MKTDSRDFATWLRRFGPARPDAVKLVCFPHAGGSASFFRPLSAGLSPDVDVLAVQYAGRQDRRHEPFAESIPDMAEQIVAVLHDLAGHPLALFGHSMGAVVAYEVALRMMRDGMPEPLRLFASGRYAPSRYRDDGLAGGTDAEVLARLQQMNGTDKTMLIDPELQQMILPAVRGDYRVVEAYRHEPGRSLTCPLTVMTGDSDPWVSVDDAQSWREHTTGPADIQVFPGAHFYLIEQSGPVMSLLSQRLTPCHSGASIRHGD